jgi:hypothetical protein
MPIDDQALPRRGIHLDFRRENDTPAEAAARAFLHGYGISTKPYVESGGDHPMMLTLPGSFEAFARRQQGLLFDLYNLAAMTKYELNQGEEPMVSDGRWEQVMRAVNAELLSYIP